MGTPAKVFIAFVSQFLAFSIFVWWFTLLCDRAYALHTIYREESKRLVDEAWLLEKCQDPVFYANLKSHTDLCTQVESNAMRSLVLYAAKQVMQTTYVCGARSCVDWALEVALWFTNLSTPFLVAAVFAMAMFPVCFSQMVRMFGQYWFPHQGYWMTNCNHYRDNRYLLPPHDVPEMRLLHNMHRRYPMYSLDDDP